MMKRMMLLAILTAVAAGAGCCGVCRPHPLRPFWPPCDPTYCCEPCGPECAPPCGAECETACEPACGPPAGPHYGPLSWFFRRVQWSRCFGVAGCGETYWGDWRDQPPDCCDPCDRCGNWTGGAGRGTGYSSMYPGGAYGYGADDAAYDHAQGQAAMPGANPACQDCGQARALRSGQPRMVARPDRGVTAAAYQPLAQRPSQSYRDPVQR